MESSPKDGQVLTSPPSRVSIRFNSRIVHSLSRATLLDPNRRKIPLAPLQEPGAPPAPDRLVLSLPPLEAGKYLVEWQVLSEDGHITRGSFSFLYVQEPRGQ